MPSDVTQAEPPALDIDPFSMELVRDRQRFQELVRETAPIVRIPKYGFYATGRYEEAQRVLSDYENFSSESGTGLGNIKKGQAWRVKSAIVEADPPDHTRVRKMLTRVLSPIVVRRWRETFDEEAGRMVEKLVARGSFDGVKELVEPFVIKVFPDAMGVDDEARENFLILGDQTANGFGPDNELTRKSQAEFEPILPWFNARFEREKMLPGGFGAAMWAAHDAGEVTRDDMLGILRTFLRGGSDTVISGVSSALWMLASHPEQWEMVRADPSLARAAFEEAIRLESPAQMIFRTTSRPVEIAGYGLEPETKVLCALGAANRDPRFWTDPETYDIRRSNAAHLALGRGIHVCIGQMIARAEAEAVIKALIARAPRLEMNGEAVHRISNSARRLETLPLRVA